MRLIKTWHEFMQTNSIRLPVVEFLRPLGHDVLTVQEAGNAGLGIPDEDALAFTASNEQF